MQAAAVLRALMAVPVPMSEAPSLPDPARTTRRSKEEEEEEEEEENENKIQWVCPDLDIWTPSTRNPLPLLLLLLLRLLPGHEGSLQAAMALFARTPRALPAAAKVGSARAARRPRADTSLNH